MLRKSVLISLAALLLVATGGLSVKAQSVDEDDYYDDRVKVDRYLDVEIWTDHSDGEYYENDNIVVYFRASRDAFVAIYTIDTKGRVSLLFPSSSDEDNFVSGGVTYRLPGDEDSYDLVVTGPEGFENIQIVASREKFPIPNWYHNSGLVCDWDDRYDYMDYLNSEYFVRYGGQRFAYDRAVVYINEWEDDYWHPVYYPYYPSWTVCGNCYIDYPWGATVYVNGIYWGCAPLYIPRIAAGWHTITIYDRHGYCWESDFHVSRYNTVVFDKTIVNPTSGVKSKYKEVREVGYRAPDKSGYPDYKDKTLGSSHTVSGSTAAVGSSSVVSSKKYVKGSTKMIKTDRGYETDGSTAVFKSKKTRSTTSGSSGMYSAKKSKSSAEAVEQDYSSDKKSSGYSTKVQSKGSSDKTATYEGSTKKSSSSSSSSSGSSGFYQKESGSSSKSESKSESKSTYRTAKSSTSGKKTTSEVKQKETDKSSSETYKTVQSSKKSSSSKSSNQSGSVKSSTGSSDKRSVSTKSSSGTSKTTTTTTTKSKGRK